MSDFEIKDLKKTKFTPGPWVVEIDYDTEIEICADVRPDGDYISIATIENDSKKAKANANLISSAPDLYKALVLFIRANAPSCRSCEEMGEAWCSECSINIAKHEAVKALMKADGEATFDDRINPNV